MKIAVLGAGAFGTALSIVFSSAKHDVTLWSRSQEHAENMQKHRQNETRLKGANFPNGLIVTSNIDDFSEFDAILMSVPMQSLRSLCQEFMNHLKDKMLVACCKGFEVETGTGPTAILDEITSKSAILTGPSFAHDIAAGLPTALTIASKNAQVAADLQSGLSNFNLRLYSSDDPIGAELGGALKNVIAIGCGATMGAGLGDSARAALMTRGYAEMLRMAHALGAKTQTLSGLSGLGDLSLTCMSAGSRNYSYGYALGSGKPYDPKITIEGAKTAKAILVKASKLGIDMPISQAVFNITHGSQSVQAAMQELLSRPQRKE